MESPVRLGISLTGTGSFVPSAYLDNHQLSQVVDTSDDWITTRTGIRRRHLLPPSDSLTNMATQAAPSAMDKRFTALPSDEYPKRSKKRLSGQVLLLSRWTGS